MAQVTSGKRGREGSLQAGVQSTDDWPEQRSGRRARARWERAEGQQRRGAALAQQGGSACRHGHRQ
eukprot:1867316-Alexandrium_andersonii.AAC.1